MQGAFRLCLMDRTKYALALNLTYNESICSFSDNLQKRIVDVVNTSDISDVQAISFYKAAS